MTARIGAGPLGWFDDDFDSFRNDIAREAHLHALSRARFDGLCLNPATTSEVTAVHLALARHRLEFIAASHRIALTSRPAADVFAELQASVGAAHALGARDFSVCDLADGTMTETDWQAFGARLNELAANCATLGVRLVYRPAPATAVATAVDIDRLMAATGAAVGLMLDAPLLGPDAFDVARRHAARIAILAEPTDAVRAALPDFTGWVMIDAHAGHAAERVRHAHDVADMPLAA
jgi:inosose dehydratase